MSANWEARFRIALATFFTAVSIFTIWLLVRCGNPGDALWYSFVLSIQFSGAVTQWYEFLVGQEE